MKIPFKSATGTPNQLKDTDFSDCYASVNGALKWRALRPYIEQSAQLYILPFIGQKMYDQLVEDYLNDTQDDSKLVLINLLRTALAYYAIYHAMPKLNTVIAERGIQEQSDSKGHARPSGMWRFKNTRWDVMLNADEFLDLLLQAMQSAMDDGNDYVDDWKESDAFKRARTSLFRNPTELSAYIRIKGSRKAFLQLVPYLKKAERDLKRNILCTDLFTKMIDRDNLNNAETELLVFAQEVVAMKALADSIPDLRVLIDGDGIQFVMTTDGMNVRKEAYDSAVADLQHNTTLKARQATTNLLEYLYQNADDFPDWKNSDCFHEEDDSHRRDSTGAIDI